MKRFLPALILLLLTAATTAFIFKDRIGRKPGEAGSATPRMAQAARAVSVLTATVAKTHMPVYLHGVGTVQPFNETTVRPQVTGRLIAVEFTEGETVRQGEVLARIEPTRYQAAYDQVVAKRAMNESALANAEADLKRAEKLAKSSYASAQTLEAQRAAVEQLKAQLRQDQAAIESARTDLDHTVIRAPIDGRTGIREVDVGNLVTSGEAGGIVTISQLQPISVIFTLPETHIAELLAAQRRGEAPLQANVGGKAVAEGKLAVIDSRIDQSTGTVRLKGTFPNDPMTLWPGQYVSVRLHLKTLENATVVPIAALQQGASERFVYKIQPDSTVRLTPVKVAREDERQAVIASGIEPGEQVTISGFTNLKDGAKIEIDDGRPKPAAPREENGEAPPGVSSKEGEASRADTSEGGAIGSAHAAGRDGKSVRQ